MGPAILTLQTEGSFVVVYLGKIVSEIRFCTGEYASSLRSIVIQPIWRFRLSSHASPSLNTSDSPGFFSIWGQGKRVLLSHPFSEVTEGQEGREF